MAPVVRKWRDTIREGQRHAKDFQKQASTCMSYIKGPFDHIWKGRQVKGKIVEGDLEDIPAPTHQVDVNKAFEYKAIYGPMLYFRNPTYRFTTRKFPELPPEVFGFPGDPAVTRLFQGAKVDAFLRDRRNAGIGALISHYLNWAMFEVDQKAESRKVVDEALLKGLGIWWHELYTPPGSDMVIPIASWQTCDNFIIDPDSEDGLRGAMWIARRLYRPTWLLESENGLPQGLLPGTIESAEAQGENRRRKNAKGQRNRGKTYDVQEYWEIYSKIGFGHHLRDIKLPAATRQLMDGFGPFCRILIANNVPFPLNLHSAMLDTADQDALFLRAQWPIPLHLDGRWPCDTLAFHWLPGDLYPTSPLEPALGELKFLSWGMSHLAAKIRTTCRDFLAVIKAVGEEMKNKILHGGDMTLLEIERHHGKTIQDVVSFLQHPEMNGDIFRVMQAMSYNVEQRLGLAPRLYGESPSQDRSAEESRGKQANMSIRPDDMLSCVEDSLSLVGRSQAMTCRWHVGQRDVAPLLGPYGAAAWRNVMDADVETITRELEYRVEAGSTTKPNTAAEREFMQGALNVMLPILIEQARLFGDYSAVNNLLSDWAKAHGGDTERYLVQPQKPLPQPQPGQGGGKKSTTKKKAA
ncbi:MAG TPA: hypothetical protein VM243_11940 [Phycisphaerae bacterium]|nr:hypothetical protein [Phycisphaerae bacterium]